MVTVLGYAFDADIYCLECTQEYCKDKLKEQGWLLEREAFNDLTLEELTRIVKDSEGNDLHPVFDTDEQINFDQPCGSWSPDTHEIIVQEANYFEESYMIEKILEKVLTLTRHTYVEKIEKSLLVDGEDPTTTDELLDALRGGIYGDSIRYEESPFQITNEERKYHYWYKGHWLSPTDLVEQIRDELFP